MKECVNEVTQKRVLKLISVGNRLVVFEIIFNFLSVLLKNTINKLMHVYFTCKYDIKTIFCMTKYYEILHNVSYAFKHVKHASLIH